MNSYPIENIRYHGQTDHVKGEQTMRTQELCLFLAALFALLTHSAQSLAATSTGTVSVEIDTAITQGAVRDLLGVNRKPTFDSKTSALSYDASSLYTAFGVSQIRLHDSGVSLCSTYTAATKLNTGVTPQVAVSGCSLTGTTGFPHFTWSPSLSADADLNNTANYDFTDVDEALSKATATGARVYLRLGENFNGPNDTSDPTAWAKVATNIYRHVIGVFKPTAGIAVDPVYVEIHNEPDGGFWQGDTATFNTLFIETAQRVRAAAAAAGKTVKLGGAGFTKDILTTSRQTGNPAKGFINAVGVSNLDFYSAHLYDHCSTATLQSAATFLRSLRSLVNSQGGTGKPLHISEWNIGLDTQCSSSGLFADQHTQSFASGVLTLMQDPAQSIEAAHFYAGVPIMALFDFTTATGIAKINPSAWAFWAHARLRGATALSAQICPLGGTCVAGYAADSAALVALAGQANGVQSVVVTNDGSAAVSYTLRVKGLTTTSVTANVSNPPQGAQNIATSGSPVAVVPSVLTALIASVTSEAYPGLTVTGGQVELALSIPARSVQVVEVRPSSDIIAPTVPAGITATIAGATQINLSWTASTDSVGVTAYKLYRSGTLIMTLGNVTSVSDTGLTASTNYSYTVVACDAAGNCSAPSGAVSATTASATVIAATVIEFYNTVLDNYFITADAGEGAAIDKGSAGAGWIRTGYTFKSGGSTSACRFYGSPVGPNSHFYTADSGECTYLKSIYNPAVKSWKFESNDFLTTAVPASGICPASTTPVYRAYNDGFSRGVDSNHRISSSLTAIQQVVARGWNNEGVVMCAPQ